MLNKPWHFYMYYSKGYPRLLARLKYLDFGIMLPNDFHLVFSPFRWGKYAERTKYVTTYRFGPFRLTIYRR